MIAHSQLSQSIQGSTELIQQCQRSETSQQGDLKNMILGFQRDKLKMSCITFVLTHESNNMANQSQLTPVAYPYGFSYS